MFLREGLTVITGRSTALADWSVDRESARRSYGLLMNHTCVSPSGWAQKEPSKSSLWLILLLLGDAHVRACCLSRAKAQPWSSCYPPPPPSVRARWVLEKVLRHWRNLSSAFDYKTVCLFPFFVLYFLSSWRSLSLARSLPLSLSLCLSLALSLSLPLSLALSLSLSPSRSLSAWLIKTVISESL